MYRLARETYSILQSQLADKDYMFGTRYITKTLFSFERRNSLISFWILSIVQPH